MNGSTDALVKGLGGTLDGDLASFTELEVDGTLDLTCWTCRQLVIGRLRGRGSITLKGGDFDRIDIRRVAGHALDALTLKDLAAERLSVRNVGRKIVLALRGISAHRVELHQCPTLVADDLTVRGPIVVTSGESVSLTEVACDRLEVRNLAARPPDSQMRPSGLTIDSVTAEAAVLLCDIAPGGGGFQVHGVAAHSIQVRNVALCEGALHRFERCTVTDSVTFHGLSLAGTELVVENVRADSLVIGALGKMDGQLGRLTLTRGRFRELLTSGVEASAAIFVTQSEAERIEVDGGRFSGEAGLACNELDVTGRLTLRPRALAEDGIRIISSRIRDFAFVAPSTKGERSMAADAADVVLSGTVVTGDFRVDTTGEFGGSRPDVPVEELAMAAASAGPSEDRREADRAHVTTASQSGSALLRQFRPGESLEVAARQASGREARSKPGSHPSVNRGASDLQAGALRHVRLRLEGRSTIAGRVIASQLRNLDERRPWRRAPTILLSSDSEIANLSIAEGVRLRRGQMLALTDAMFECSQSPQLATLYRSLQRSGRHAEEDDAYFLLQQQRTRERHEPAAKAWGWVLGAVFGWGVAVRPVLRALAIGIALATLILLAQQLAAGRADILASLEASARWSATSWLALDSPKDAPTSSWFDLFRVVAGIAGILLIAVAGATIVRKLVR